MSERLVAALRHLASEHDELVMIVKGFERHMRKNPFSDEEIRGGLESIRAHVTTILDGEPSQVTNA